MIKSGLGPQVGTNTEHFNRHLLIGFINVATQFVAASDSLQVTDDEDPTLVTTLDR